MGSFLRSVAPFIELMRVSNPVGSYLVFIPYFIGFVSAIDRAQPFAVLCQLVASRTAIFAFAAFMLHAFGCSWNDFVDADIDRKVARTKNRPLARRAISPPAAITFILAEMILWLAIVSIASWDAVLWSLPLIPATLLYPYCKRFLPVPSIFLGLVFGWSVFAGACGIAEGQGVGFIDSRVFQGLICHFGAYVFWMALVDTIYAFQDIEDDLKVGIYSMAVTFRSRPRLAMSVLATAQIGFLSLAGSLLDVGGFYHTTVWLVAAPFDIWMVSTVRLDSPQDCWLWFQNGGLVMQGIVATGILGDLLISA